MIKVERSISNYVLVIIASLQECWVKEISENGKDSNLAKAYEYITDTLVDKLKIDSESEMQQ